MIRGLQKLIGALAEYPNGGVALYTDGEEIYAEQYEGTRRLYYCGREYQHPPAIKNEPYLLVVIDANEATIGATDGENIRVLWSDCSWVPRKHDKGGQSERRFERGREEALKAWLRKVVEKMLPYIAGKQIIIGGPGMTKAKFIEEIPSYIRTQVIRIDSCGYTDENGLWELMGKSRYVK